MADGYKAAFGDFADPRIWEPVALHGRTISVLTAASFEVSRALTPLAQDRYPDLTRIAVVRTPEEAQQYRTIGVQPVINRSLPPGLDLAVLVLQQLGVEPGRIQDWMRRQQDRALSSGADLAA